MKHPHFRDLYNVNGECHSCLSSKLESPENMKSAVVMTVFTYQKLHSKRNQYHHQTHLGKYYVLKIQTKREKNLFFLHRASSQKRVTVKNPKFT